MSTDLTRLRLKVRRAFASHLGLTHARTEIRAAPLRTEGTWQHTNRLKEAAQMISRSVGLRTIRWYLAGAGAWSVRVIPMSGKVRGRGGEPHASMEFARRPEEAWREWS